MNVVVSLMFLALLVFAVLAVLRARAARRVLPSDSDALIALRRHDSAVGTIGRGVGFLMFMLSVGGVIAMDLRPLEAPLAGVLTILALMGMERWWPAPAGTVRTATLHPRRMDQLLNGPGVAAACVGLLVGLAATLSLLLPATQAQLDRKAQLNPGAGAPPNAWLGIVGVLVLIGVAWLAVRQLIARAALAGLSSEIDTAFRRAGVDRLLRLVAVVGLLMAFAILQFVWDGLSDTPASLVMLAAWVAMVELWRVRPPRQLAETVAVQSK